MFQLARAEKADLPRILEIQRMAFRSEAELYGDPNIPPLQQTLEQMETEFEKKVFLKAVADSQIVGSVRGELAGYACTVNRLIVAPAFQGRGIGTALLLEIEKVFPQACIFELFTGMRSERNLALYEKNGYRIYKKKELSPKVTLVYLEKGIR